MGTNYYIVRKSVDNTHNKLQDMCNEIFESNDFQKIFKDLLLYKFEKPLNLLAEEHEDNVIHFKMRLDDLTNEFASSIKYDLCEAFNLSETDWVHIGKSSMGWLFCFQDQSTTLNRNRNKMA